MVASFVSVSRCCKATKHHWVVYWRVHTDGDKINIPNITLMHKDEVQTVPILINSLWPEKPYGNIDLGQN